MNIVFIVPTLNPKLRWREWLEAYARQTFKPIHALVIDSSSTDHSVQMATEYGFNIVTIKKEDFGHGKTRQYALNIMPGSDVIIYMTQDAILDDEYALENLVAPLLKDPSIGVVYGRQLPHIGATAREAHARAFNYSSVSKLKSKSDIPILGIKTAFCSNSFAAYRVSALQAVGGFPSDVIFGEDMYIAAKMILADFKVFYESKALCRHSHNFSIADEFRRSFDTGSFHASEPWLLECFGKPHGEGLRFVTSELSFLLRKDLFSIPSAFLATLAKFLGYYFGYKKSCR